MCISYEYEFSVFKINSQNTFIGEFFLILFLIFDDYIADQGETIVAKSSTFFLCLGKVEKYKGDQGRSNSQPPSRIST